VARTSDANRGDETFGVAAQLGVTRPGHKTTDKASKWIADLLRDGLLHARCIPPKSIPPTCSRIPGAGSHPPSLAGPIWPVSRATQLTLIASLRP
jgi:hypothetical protein